MVPTESVSYSMATVLFVCVKGKGGWGMGEGSMCYPKYLSLIRMLKIKEGSHGTMLVFFFFSPPCHSKGHALLMEF